MCGADDLREMDVLEFPDLEHQVVIGPDSDGAAIQISYDAAHYVCKKLMKLFGYAEEKEGEE